ncbi:TonB-dependent receptor plug domain-containing protein [Hydrogenimonas sp.]
MVKRTISMVMLGTVMGFSAENMDALLKAYQSESELSKITKSESAGFLDIYTREELEKMQVHTLMDVFKLFTIPNITRTSDNINLFTKPTFPIMPPFAIRLYVNDHDMTSSSFGSALMLWSDMPVEYIDHIEVYKSAASVEFGNEPGSVIIKLYTKRPEREEGGKVRLMADQRGSYETDAYYAHTSKDRLSYFFYIHKDDTHRKTYRNAGHDLNDDKRSHTFYMNLYKDEWRLEGGSYHKIKGNFLGLGRQYTPEDGEIDTKHAYLQLEKRFDNDLKLRIGYDHLDCYEKDVDASGIPAGSAGYVTNYSLQLHDDILSLIGEKSFTHTSGKLLLGAFYKYKGITAEGDFDGAHTAFDNVLHLSSLYLEESFYVDPETTLIASFKGDHYRFQKEVETKKEHILRAGIIRNIGHLQLKAFYTRTYYAVPMLYLYGPDDMPYKTNPKLKNPKPTLTSFGFRYKEGPHTLDARMSLITVKDKVLTAPDGTLFNKRQGWYHQYELKYAYMFDHDTRIKLDFYKGENSARIVMSPKFGGNLQLFGTFGKFDLYGEVNYRGNYTVYGVEVDPSYDCTAAVKYHITKDLSLGLRGENIFGTGFKQAYKGLSYPLPVFDRKFWINMEYLF